MGVVLNADTDGPRTPDTSDGIPSETPHAALSDTLSDTLSDIGDNLAAVLARGGAPAQLAGQVRRRLGNGAASALSDDPWLLLGVESVRPEQADAFARALLGAEARPDDPRRIAALVRWLLERAARDGHTVVPLPHVLAVLGHFGCDGDAALPAVLESDGVLPLPATTADAPVDDGGSDADSDIGDTGSRDTKSDDTGTHDTGTHDTYATGEPAPLDPERLVLALERLAMAEESVAEAVARLTATALPWPKDRPLASSGFLVSVAAGFARSGVIALTGAAAGGLDEATDALVEALRGDGVGTVRVPAREAATAAVEPDGEGGVVVVSDADALGVEDAAALLERVEDGVRVVLVGDPALLPPIAPGQVLADLAAGGAVPAVRAPSAPNGAIGRLAAGLRAGTLPVVDSPDRDVVVVGARDAADVGRRVAQLVGDSIPRALGIPSHEVAVLTPLRGGEAGAERLGALVSATTGAKTNPDTGTGTEALTVHDAGRRRWPAVVVALPAEAAGVLDRALLLTAVTRGTRHVSIVHAAGEAVAVAAARVPGRPRNSRLPLAVREALAGL